MTTRRAAPAARLLALALAIAGMWLLVGARPAAAHASLVRVTPGDGARIGSAPARVTMTFDENVRSPSVIIVTGAEGQRVNTGKTRVLNNTISTRVAIAEGGRYTAVFRVVSADGHPVSGTTHFTVIAGGTASGAARPTAGNSEVQDSGPVVTRGWVIGSVAAVALLVGIMVLTPARQVLPGSKTGDKR